MTEGSLATAGQMIGISKTRTVVFIQEILELIRSHQNETICIPKNLGEWNEIIDAIEQATGFPNCVEAIDGSLVEIKRFGNFDGWYCRKGFPAFSIQLVVDHKRKIRSFSLRCGSKSDKGVFNRSDFGQNIHQLIPRGTFFLADAGY